MKTNYILIYNIIGTPLETVKKNAKYIPITFLKTLGIKLKPKNKLDYKNVEHKYKLGFDNKEYTLEEKYSTSLRQIDDVIRDEEYEEWDRYINSHPYSQHVCNDT